MHILRKYFFVLLSLTFLSSCLISRRKKINLDVYRPYEVIAIKQNADSGFTFYFEKTAIEKTVKDLICKSRTKDSYSEYLMKILDSLQQKNGFILETTLSDSIIPGIMNPYSSILDIKDILIPKGKVWIMRPDSSFVTVMIKSVEKGKLIKRQIGRRMCPAGKTDPISYTYKLFTDEKDGKIIHLIDLTVYPKF